MKLLFVLSCALLYANALPFFGSDESSEEIERSSEEFDGALSKIRGRFGKIAKYPIEVARLHAAMPAEIMTNPLHFTEKFAKRVVGTPKRVFDHVKGTVSDVSGKIKNKGKKVVEEVALNAEEAEIVNEFNDLAKLSTEMDRRGGVMKQVINNHYEEQKKSLLLTKKEKESVAAAQREFNEFHIEMMGKMKASKDMNEVIALRGQYLEKTLPLFDSIQANKCTTEYDAEETEIMQSFPTPDVLTTEMDRRAGVMINAITKHYNGIINSEESTAEEKQEATEKLAATLAYHEEKLNQMREAGDMDQTMCYRKQYLVELLGLFNTLLALKQ